MDELYGEQFHLHRKAFVDFLKAIQQFAQQKGVAPANIFFSYAWPRENLDQEAWHTQFVKQLAIHIDAAGLGDRIDQLHSGGGHELNAFMNEIKSADRVFVFDSKTRDYKLSLPVSGVGYENQLIVECKVEKSDIRPFAIHIRLSEESALVTDSKTDINAPVVKDYLLLLKWLIKEIYQFDQTFDVFWQKKIEEHKIPDNLHNVPNLTPNSVRRASLLDQINNGLSTRRKLICSGLKGAGKKQLCVSYVWENYFRYPAVYWFEQGDVPLVSLKPGSLVVINGDAASVFLKEVLLKHDVRVIIISERADLYPEHCGVKVEEFLKEEAEKFVFTALGHFTDCEKLLDAVGLVPAKLVLACGYIQRNRISILEFTDAYKKNPELLSQFNLLPIREVSSAVSSTHTKVKKPNKASFFVEQSSKGDIPEDAARSSHKPQIADPLPDNPKKEKQRFEEQQAFCGKSGHEELLLAVGQKLVVVPKIVFISFSRPDIETSNDQWTQTFVDSFVLHLNKLGIVVYFMGDKNLDDYIKINHGLLDNIHVFVIGSRSREKDIKIQHEDEEILTCLAAYPALKKIGRRFIVPVTLTSEKHMNDAYGVYAAHSFYEKSYEDSLRELFLFLYNLKPDFELFWTRKSLKYGVSSNWWPHRPPVNENFVGRKKMLKQVYAHFSTHKNFVVLSALHGIGGVGKSQVALRFGHKYCHKFTRVFWFVGDTKEKLLEQYVRLGIDNNLFQSKHEQFSFEEKAKLVFDWMQNTLPVGWLLIIDDAKNFDDIREWIPAKGGRVLITSRHTEWPGQQSIPVGLFSIKRAKEYIFKVLNEEQISTIDDLQTLIEKLGRLPLAIAQACAYIKNTPNMTIKRYLEIYDQKQKELKSAQLLTGVESHNAVAVTWSVTLAHMESEFPDAVRLMYLCTQVRHDNIPKAFLEAFFNDPTRTVNAIRVAFEYSMITLDEMNGLIGLHILVQEVIAEKLNQAEATTFLTTAVEALDRSCNTEVNKENVPYKKIVFPHCEFAMSKINKWIEKDDVYDKKTKKEFLLTLYKLLDNSYQVTGQRKKQKDLLDDELLLIEALHGLNSVPYVQARVRLAGTLRALGDPAEQKKIIEEVFSIVESSGDKEWLIKTYCDLAHAYRDLGFPYVQLEKLEKAYEIAKHALDERHVLLARIRIDLAGVHGALGHAEKEIELNDLARPVILEKMGPDHPHLAVLYTGSGISYRVLRKLDESVNNIKEAIRIYREAYGDTHPEVAGAMLCLSNTYDVMGDYSEQKKLLKQALAIKLQHFSLEHPQVARIHIGLSLVSENLKKSVKAKEYAKKALDGMSLWHKDVAHPDLIQALNRAARANIQDDCVYALSLASKALKAAQACYGSKTPQKIKESVILFFELGQKLVHKHQWQKALDFYKAGIDVLNTDESQSWSMKSVKLTTDIFSENLEADINLVAVGQFFMGQCFFELKDAVNCQNALVQLKEFVEQHPDELNQKLFRYLEKKVIDLVNLCERTTISFGK